MKNKIKEFLFGKKHSKDVEEENKEYKCKSSPAIWKTIVPGNMTMEQWEKGGYSEYNHPVKIRHLKRV